MPPPAGPGAIDSPGDSLDDSPAARAIAALRAQGAGLRDPVRFHFIEALARRTAATRGTARALLEGRLARAIDDYAARCEGVPGRADAPGDAPAAASPLAELLDHLARENRSGFGPAVADGAITAPDELKAVACFRDTWDTLRLERQLHEVLADEPENAGPLNSHLLVLRALRQMHQTSPAYLKRFMDYADTLLWLEQADGGAKPAPKNIVLGERDKKRKTARGKGDG